MIRWSVWAVVPAVLASHALAEIVAPQRRIAWAPGVPGGIDEGAPTVNVADYGTVADSITDDHEAFRQAIDALPSGGGNVLIPAGTYRISQSLQLGTGVVLRGEGCAETKLYFSITDGSPCIDIVTYARGAWVDVVGGYEKGSQRVVVGDASSFSPGTFAEIQQRNDSTLMYTDPRWEQSWSENAVGQVMVVEDVADDTLILNRPLYIGYRPELDPQIRTQGFVERAGVERLFIARTDPDADGPTFSLKNAAYCWIREVESYHTRKAHITTSTVYASEFRDCYFHHAFDYGGGGHGYGVSLGFHTTDCLVENTIFRHLRHAMMVQVGACGNVYGYNFSLDNVQGSGETNLNQGWTPCDISLHGHYPYCNLFEGNVVQEIDVADYWGPCGPGNTFLRNRVLAEGLDILDASHGQNVVGNELGSGSYGLSVEHSVNGTLAHGNDINGTTQWNDSIADRTIPVSYYRSVKPPFFGDSPWPVIGPDAAGAAMLPARQRYECGQYVTEVAAPGPGEHPPTVNPKQAARGTRMFDCAGRVLKNMAPPCYRSSGMRVLLIEKGGGVVPVAECR